VHSIYPFLRQDQTTVVPLGELSLFTHYLTDAKEESNVVLFFGRIRTYKGLEYFIEAAALVAQKMPTARFIIAGDGDLRPYLKLIKDEYNIEIINRYIPDDEVATIFRQASLVVLPYTQASQSAVIPVAYAFEKPVVTTRVGCLPDVVEDGRTGLIVPPHDAPALADAIIKLLQNDTLRKTLGRNGYVMMKAQLGWEKISSITFNTYKKVIDEFSIRNQ